MRLTVLGCAGTFPGPDSPCSSYLLEHEGYRLMIDMGNGAAGNLQRCGDVLALDAVVVSHLHGDHCLDLVSYAYARHYDPRQPAGSLPRLPVYGPATLHDRLAQAFDKPRPDMVDNTYDVQVVGGEPLELGPFRLTFARTNHPVETYAVRADAGGRGLVYSADTGVCEDLVALARGADLFLCEASYLDGVDNPPGIHLTGGEAADHATRAEVDRLMLTHLVPWYDPATVLEQASGFGGRLERARPCTAYDV